MPLDATTIQNIERADVWEVVRIIIETSSFQLIIVYRIGLRQADGSVRWVRDNLSFTVNATELAKTVPMVGETLYVGIKRVAYSLGQSNGVFPAGSVT